MRYRRVCKQVGQHYETYKVCEECGAELALSESCGCETPGTPHPGEKRDKGKPSAPAGRPSTEGNRDTLEERSWYR